MNTIQRYLCLNLLCIITVTLAMNAQSKIVIRPNFSSGVTNGTGIGTGTFRVIGSFGGIVGGRTTRYSAGFLATPKQIQPSEPTKDTTATFPLQVQWSDSSGAHLFVVEVSISKDFSNPIYKDSIRRATAPSYNFTTQLPAEDPFSINTPYYLRIVAIHHGGIAVVRTPIQITMAAGIGPLKIIEPISGQEYSACNGDSLPTTAKVIGGKRPYKYEWKRADGTKIPTQDTSNSPSDTVKVWKNIPEGTTQMMELQVKDASSPALTVTQKWALIGKKQPRPVITASPKDTICNGDGTATLSIQKGYTSIKWKLDSNIILNETKETITINKAGKYIVEVDSNGCRGPSAMKEIYIYKKPAISITPKDTSVTIGTTVTFRAVTNGSTPTSYSWKDKNGVLPGDDKGTIAYQVTEEGSITLIYHYGDGSCVDSISTSIKISDPSNPTVSLGRADKDSICFGGEIILVATLTGGISPFTKVWKKDDTVITEAGVISPDSLTLRMKPTDVGTHTYSITVVDGNSMSDTKSKQITVNALPAKPTIDTSGDTMIVLTSEKIYQWLNGSKGTIDNATNQTYKPDKSGEYYVRVTNASGCDSTSDKFTFILNSGNDTTSIPISMSVTPNAGKPGEIVEVKLEWYPRDQDTGRTFSGRLLWNTGIAECVTPSTEIIIEKQYGKESGGISFKNIPFRRGLYSYIFSLEILLGDTTQTSIQLVGLTLSSGSSTTRLIPKMRDSIITVTGVKCDSSGILRLVRWKPASTVTVSVFPNPSTSSSTIMVEPRSSEGLVEVYSVYGEKMLSTPLEQGSVQISSKNLSDGVYSIVARTADGIGRTTMVVVK